MPNIHITPLAFESLGVRSSALYVETDDVKIVIDPAVALAPKRFGLPPHNIEEEAKNRLWLNVKNQAESADILIVTHYHYDHVEPEEPDLYDGKIAILKHPKRMINPSQKQRAASFIKDIKKIVGDIRYADHNSYFFGNTVVSFSAPVPHGATSTRGYVVEVCIEVEDTFLFSSDVQGPLLDEHIEFILEKQPEIIFIDGPSTYLNNPIGELELQKANKYLVKIIRETSVESLVVDHHLTRDLDYRLKINPVIKAGSEAGVKVEVAAEFLDVEPNLLEARRNELYLRGES